MELMFKSNGLHNLNGEIVAIARLNNKGRKGEEPDSKARAKA